MMKDEAKTEPRRAYTPPLLTKIRIRLDEVVLAGCKQAGAGGMPAPSCLMGCSQNAS
jgi:hypothetical protein